MNTRQVALVAIMLGMVGLTAAYRLYQFETKPFDTVAFVNLIVSKGYVVSYDPEVKDPSVDLHLNQPYRAPDHFHHILAYFIDTDRIVKDWRLQWSWKQFVRSALWDNARAFFPERILIVDGGMLRRVYPRPTAAKPTSTTALALGSGKIDRKTYINLIFLHELTHLVDTKYMLPDSIPEAARQHYEEGTHAMYSGDFDRAQTMLRKAVDEFRWYPDALDHLGLIARRKGNVSEALVYYERSLDINPQGEIALQDMIPALVVEGNGGRALDVADRLETAHADNPEGPFWKAFLLMSAGKWVAAVPELDHAHRLYLARKSPAVVDVDVLRVKAFRRLSETERERLAISDLKNSCKLYPKRARSVPECGTVVEPKSPATR